jgi:hypothetical protein
VYEGTGEGSSGDGPLPGFLRRGGGVVATTTAVPREIVDVIADEMAWGVERAVEYWMSQIEHALADRQLTSLGRLYAVKDVLEHYRSVTGRVALGARRA